MRIPSKDTTSGPTRDSIAKGASGTARGIVVVLAFAATGARCGDPGPPATSPRDALVRACGRVAPDRPVFTSHYAPEALLDDAVLGASIHVPDPDLLWVLRPSLAPRPEPPPDPARRLPGAWRIATDSHGLAGMELSLPMHPLVFRILCVGDETSLPFGNGLDAMDPWPSRLEDALNERHPSAKVEVVNASVPGHSSAQMLRSMELWWQRVGPPSVLLLATGWHDASPAPIEDAELLGRAAADAATGSTRRVPASRFRANLMAAEEIARRDEVPLGVVLPWSTPHDPDGLLPVLLATARTRGLPLFLAWTDAAASNHENGGTIPETSLPSAPLDPRAHLDLADRVARWVLGLPAFRAYLDRLD